MERIDVIKTKLNQLRELDPRYSIFGSSRHQYELNNTLSSEELLKIETENSISLSDEYKVLLLELGNGGAGCGYGLERMKLSNINPPYIGTDELLRNCEDPEELTVEMVELDEISGYIKLFNYGCGIETCLIVSGDEKGGLIYFDCDGAFRKLQGKGLLDIYESWLDNNLEDLLRVKNKLVAKSALSVIEEEWKEENHFIRDMIYSIMDIDPPINKTNTEEYKVALEASRLKWLRTKGN